jgi:hypothetical protein
VIAPATPTARAVVRWIVALQLAALLMQLGAALAFLSGLPQAYSMHAGIGHVLYALGVVQAVAVVAVRDLRRSRLTCGLAVALPLGEGLQIYIASRGLLVWHLALGLLVWAAALAVWIRVSARTAPLIPGG